MSLPLLLDILTTYILNVQVI